MWVCVCERERDRERNNLSVMKNYAKNGRENTKFIEDGVNMKRQNKGRWMKRWILTLRLRVVGRWKCKEWKDEETPFCDGKLCKKWKRE